MREYREAGTFGATVAIAAMVTAGFSWVPVLMGWCIITIIMLILPIRGEIQGKFSAFIILLGGIIVIAAAALGAEDAFPEDSTFPFVSAVLLLLLWRAMCGERRTPGDVANILGIILLLVLAVVVLFGMVDVSWEENTPGLCPWFQVCITVAATSPWWCLRRGPRSSGTWGWYGASAAICLGLSLLTRGILGSGLVEQEAFPLYRAVQTIRILGVLQRFEALLAASVLMGAFCILLLSGNRMAEALDILLPQKPRKWKSGIVILLAFLLEWGFQQLTNITMLETIFWIAAPVLALWVAFAGKKESEGSIDKSGEGD